MSPTRKIAAILVADVVGYSRLAATDEERTLARLRVLRTELIAPAIAVHNGRVVKRTGDGVLVEFRSVVDAVRCAVELQSGIAERNVGVPQDIRIEFRIGIHLGDVVEESDGDLMGDGVNIAARLEGVCEAGGILISEDAWRQVRDRMKIRFYDIGEQSLKNIERPMRAYRVLPAGEQTNGEAAQGHPALPDKPSIAVLPFQNMSGDAEQEYFADGIVEDIITGLSRIKWLFVIARNSTFAYKGKTFDVRQVGRELGVRYVLEGGVRKAGSRVRISAQLIDAASGAHLWADRYDGAMENVFDLQDQITDQVVGIVEPSLRRSEIERSRRKRPENLDAYDLYLRALPHVAAHMPQDARIALPLLEEALRLDPDYAAAHAHLAWCRELCFTRAGFDGADKAQALAHAQATISSTTDDATALAVAGFVLAMLSRFESEEHRAALAAIDRALSLHPACATALFLGAQAHACAAHPQQANAFAERALRLSPFDPLAFEAHMALGENAILDARYRDAVSCFARAAQANPKFSTAFIFQAIALAFLGLKQQAEPYVRRGLELEPGFRIRLFIEHALAPVISERLVKGARMLGLPE